MARPIVFILPGRLDERVGGAIYDRCIVEGLGALGYRVRAVELGTSALQPDEAARSAARAAVGDIDPGALVVVDHAALPLLGDAALGRGEALVVLMHHALHREPELDEAAAAALAEQERTLLARAARIVVASAATGRDAVALGAEPERIAVVRPGTRPGPLAQGSGEPGVHMLCVASLTPRKGHLVLLDALGSLSRLRWRLTCVGSAERDPHTARTIEARIAAHGLEDRITLAGEHDPDALEPFWAGADLKVLASHHEGYGMVLAEAVARGVPVVATAAGAVPEAVPREAGILVPPGDADALATALREVLTDDGLLLGLRQGAIAARDTLPTWEAQVRAFAAALDGLLD
jgi:glycosyltransferase involved in cell wall biosynthesis